MDDHHAMKCVKLAAAACQPYLLGKGVRGGGGGGGGGREFCDAELQSSCFVHQDHDHLASKEWPGDADDRRLRLTGSRRLG